MTDGCGVVVTIGMGSGVFAVFVDPPNSVTNPPDTKGFTTNGLRLADTERLGVTEDAGDTALFRQVASATVLAVVRKATDSTGPAIGD